MTSQLSPSAPWAAPDADLSRMLYLCPSDRAARAWRIRLAQQSSVAGAPAPCTHVEAWMADVWARALIFGLLPNAPTVLEPIIASAIWQHAARDVSDLAAPECARVAQLAEDAWQLSHRHFLDESRLNAYAESDDNIALYARLATRVRQIHARQQCATRAQLPALLAAHALEVLPLLPSAIVLTPSFSSDPALFALWQRLRELGVQVTEFELADAGARVTQVDACTDAAAEMRWALEWAAQQLAAHPEAGVALVVPNFSAKRDEWVRALRERFNANDWWLDPATDRAHFNVSAGEPLVESPYVHSVLTLLRASTHEADTERLAQALLHPRWAQPAHWRYRLSGTERRLLDDGLHRTRLSEWAEILPEPVQAWLSTLPQAAGQARSPRSMHRARIASFVAALTGAAWVPRTDLFQLDEAWSGALDAWVSLDPILGPVPWSDALNELQRIASATTFQPKAGGARLQVMGLLESAGVPLDIARVVGFDETVLPERAKPNPMLPRAWQASANVGLGSHAEVDARAQRLWRNWQALCGRLSVSWATQVEGRGVGVSPLARPLEVVHLGPPPASPLVSPSRAPSPSPVVWLLDERMPERAATGHGKSLTARALEEQAQCPRRAAASRLGLTGWPEHAVGIPARVKGTLLHAVLAAVGLARQRASRDGEDAPDDAALMAVASDALDTAIYGEQARRLRIPESVWSVERDRVLKLVRAAIALERERGGFAVVSVETELRARAFGQDFRVRLDRVDESVAASPAGALRVVFDYKTGAAHRGDWFADRTSGRLAAPQLPLYAVLLSQHEAEAAPVRALGYIMVSDDAVGYVGVGEDAALVPASEAKKDPSWETLLDSWYAQLGALVAEIDSGVADVAPLKGAQTCRYCDVAAFCREPWSLAGEDGADGDGDGDRDGQGAGDGEGEGAGLRAAVAGVRNDQ